MLRTSKTTSRERDSSLGLDPPGPAGLLSSLRPATRARSAPVGEARASVSRVLPLRGSSALPVNSVLGGRLRPMVI
jgi:hypothetical protein